MVKVGGGYRIGKVMAVVYPYWITNYGYLLDLLGELIKGENEDYELLLNGLRKELGEEVVLEKIIPHILNNRELELGVGGDAQLRLLIDFVKGVIKYRYYRNLPPTLTLERINQEILNKHLGNKQLIATEINERLGIELTHLTELERFYVELQNEIQKRLKEKGRWNESIFTEFKNKIDLYLIYAVANRIQKEVGGINPQLLHDEEYIKEKKNQLLRYIHLLHSTEKPEIVYAQPQLEQKLEFYKNLINNAFTKYKIIRTGICSLDAIFSTKGFVSGEIYFIAGRYGIGKTTFTTALGVSIAKIPNQTVVYITLELPKEMIQIIKDSYLYNLERWKLHSQLEKLSEMQKLGIPPTKVQNEIEQILNQLQQKFRDKYETDETIRNAERQFYIIQLPKDGTTPNLIDAQLEKLSSQVKPDVIIIDHFDILELGVNIQNIKKYEEKLIKQLQSIAEKYNAVVIAVSQLKMEAIKKANQSQSGKQKANPTLHGEDLAGSRVRNELAGGVFTINVSQKDEQNNIIKLYVDKNRYGIQRISLLFEFIKDPVRIRPILTDLELSEKGYTDDFIVYSTTKVREQINKLLVEDLETPIFKTLYGECINKIKQELGEPPTIDGQLEDISLDDEPPTLDDDDFDMVGGNPEDDMPLI